MNDSQAKNSFEWIEVAVAVQQFVTALNTKCRNNAVNRFANCIALVTQTPIVLGGSNRQFNAASLKYVELQEVVPYSHK